MSSFRRSPTQPVPGKAVWKILTACSILIVLAALETALVVGAHRQTAAKATRLDGLDSAHLGVRALISVLSTAVRPVDVPIRCAGCVGTPSPATALTSARADRLQLFTDGGDPSGPLLVTFDIGLDSHGMPVLEQRIQWPDRIDGPGFTYSPCASEDPGCRVREQVLVRALDSPLPGPVFTYRDGAGQVLGIAAGHDDLTPNQLQAVESVDVTLAVRVLDDSGAAPTSTVTRVAVPDATYVPPWTQTTAGA